MDILVISDSHGRQDRIEEAVSRQIKKPDAVIFLGDGQRDIAYAQLGDIPLYRVSGNCDFGGLFGTDNAPETQMVEIGGKRMFITHGHRFGVKSTITPLLSEAIKRDADVVLFGHTHEACEGVLTPDNELGLNVTKPLHVMNPGSIGSYPYSFGVVTVDREGRILLSHGTLA